MNQHLIRTKPNAASPGATPAAARMGRRPFACKGLASMAVFSFVVLPLAPCGSAYAETPAAPPSNVIQTQEANAEGVVAELTECRRSEGVLTIKVRFRNTSAKPWHVTFVGWNASGQDNPKFYVTAGNKKYFMLADSDGTVLSTNSMNGEANLTTGTTYLWWAKYPAPPADVKKVNFMMPVASPFEDVPITDK